MILSVIIQVIIFRVATLFPVLGFLLPYYGIIRTEIDGVKKTIFVKIIISLLILIMDWRLAIIYLVIFELTELLFFAFSKWVNLNKYNKIIISTCIVFIFIILFYIFYKEYLFKVLEDVRALYIKNNYSNLPAVKRESIDNVIFMMKKYILMNFFGYIYFLNFFTYFFYFRDRIKYWVISYYYLIIYIIVFILSLTLYKNSVLLDNILNMIKIPYISFAFIRVYYLTKKYIKFRFLSSLIVMFLCILFYDMFFVIGSFASFLLSKENEKS